MLLSPCLWAVWFSSDVDGWNKVNSRTKVKALKQRFRALTVDKDRSTVIFLQRGKNQNEKAVASFIQDLCVLPYCVDNDRPSIEPEVIFRMLIVGYLYGIKSEARLEEEINYNMAYKWFCGLGLTEKAPDATTISQNRRRRFRDNNIAEEIFNEILRQCIKKGLVGGNILYTDSTHIKAKANKHKKNLVMVEETPKAYLEELDAQVDQDREVLKKKPFDRDDDPPVGGGSVKKMQSKTDPESG